MMWHWVICGKHPAFKDYFHLGQKLPMVTALSEWIEKGYRGIAGGKSSPTNLLSWRFWAGGLDRDSLLCGVLKESTDSVGRPYPLVVVGLGSLTGWGTKWDLVPQACEQSWSQMESLSTRIFRSLKQLEDELVRVRSPQLSWAELGKGNTEAMTTDGDSDQFGGAESLGNIESRVVAMGRSSEIFVSLDEGPSQDPLTIMHLWHACLKKYHPEPPKTVFMGGNANENYLAFFHRALMTQDFVRLWSL
jgi:type VI secretion system protein VasJ